ncbi:hypothetical protein OQA88_1331 [Cercophora sp. LCS_1]
MLRRPPGQVASKRGYLLALAIIILPWLKLADAQQQHSSQPAQHHVPSPHEDDHGAPQLAATSLPRTDRRKSTIPSGADDSLYESKNNVVIPNDASARVAPDLSVRAVPSFRTNDVGLSQQIARRLEDWEVEDYVLLATVNGDLYANDRTTGHERWHYKADRPMVETTHFRTNKSELEEDFDPIDHYIWIVEPTRDGELYLWDPSNPGAGLTKTGLTMKSVVQDVIGSADKINGIMWTGEKKTTLVTFNAATGAVIKEFGSGGTYINKLEAESCSRRNAIADPAEEGCTEGGSITLGRTEYTAVIHREDGSPVASLKYSEWGPNTHDNDLIRQNQVTKDKRYITGQHDGMVYGFDYARSWEERPYFIKKLSSPVARVFDVLRRCMTPGADPDIIAIPQPPIPADEDNLRHRSEKVFINQTETGSWYALSGMRYPLVVQAKPAEIQTREWWRHRDLVEDVDDYSMSRAMVGIHRLPEAHRPVAGQAEKERLLIDAPSSSDPTIPPDEHLKSNLLVPPPRNGVVETIEKVREIAAVSVIEYLSNPFTYLLLLSFLWMYKDRVFRFGRSSAKWKGLDTGVEPQVEISPSLPPPKPNSPSSSSDEVHDKATENTPIAQIESQETARVETPDAAEPPVAAIPEPTEAEKPSSDGSNGVAAEGAKKKKAHRGRRGGVKHKKNNKDKREGSQSRDDDPPQATVEEVINQVKQLGPEPKLEPDILTVPNGGDEISGPLLKMGSLEVDESKQLGTGSNGTVVFAGKWDGRDVAVKRMLVQFNEIASQETRLLRESDDHPNVIRYFAQQQRAAFLYIALELCQASLADIIQRPSQFRELAQAGERDMQDVLYQITRGLSHLHSLRIVHRDLKPQNILVNMGKDGKPRLLVSDFGLCKKLEGGQSSFGATTAHAAGTSGWRAPELLVDDDPPHSGSMMIDPNSSLHSASGSGIPGAAEIFGPNHRRVTRSIDIFSLGLVFYYVLSKGYHPFDCGDRYMREVNIRKGNYKLDDLDSLGDFAYEARDLISSMINSNPKQRPTAVEVMSHPFFWDAKKRLLFLCDVSDHFEKEPRDPPSPPLQELERWAPDVIKGGDFLKPLGKDFVDSLGKQRKYTGGRMLDLLRALRNKRNHYEDMPESLRKAVGPLPDGYLSFWATKFPNLLIACWNIIYELRLEDTDRFRDYYQPAKRYA